MSEAHSILIAHISDFHAGSQYFVVNLMSRAIDEINELEPDVVVVTGDLTEEGFRQELRTAKSFLDELTCPNLLVIPGNHDSRNVGYLHFEDLFGPRAQAISLPSLDLVGLDSSQPDLDDGQVGREKYHWLEQQLRGKKGYKLVALHHHLIPIPGTGRERNIIYDAGDFLEVLVRCGVHLILSGHKHVPYLWRLEEMLILTSGTVSSLRLRGHTQPCYNLIELSGEKIVFFRKSPFEKRELIAEFSKPTGVYCPWPATAGRKGE